MKNFISYIVFLILLLLTACGNKQNAPNADPLENNSTVIDYGKEDHNVSRDADVCIEREESHASNIVSYFVEERSNEAYEYDAYSDHIVITGITQIEPDGKLSIPSEIDGLPVTAIGNRKYSRIDHEPSISPEDLETLIIPDTVTCLGDFVFGHCYKLQSVSIPESVSEIGFGVFYRTPWLEAQTIAIIRIPGKSSGVQSAQGCVVVLGGRQPACVLRLALHDLSSPPFLS